MVARYGDFVLYRPQFKSNTYLLWLGPFCYCCWYFTCSSADYVPPINRSKSMLLAMAEAKQLLEDKEPVK